jgi:4-diphosphocytidyl-2-C-methyl-D-erythritol kinase
MTRLERSSPCKINLLLNILGKRPDGFHELETLMHPVPLYDTLTFERTEGQELTLTGSHSELPVDSSNLVWRAMDAFRQSTGLRVGLRVHLEKRLPLAAGIGAGSANAAITLLALNELFQEPLSSKTLVSLASKLGSDVPFFLQTQPALATGRGEQILPMDWFPALQTTWVVLVHPGFGVPTAWAYKALADFPEAVNGRRGQGEELARALRTSSLNAASRLFYNSLEAPVLRKYPILTLYQEFLRERGAAVTLMSGSGSSTFALVESQTQAEDLKRQFVDHFGSTCWIAVAPLSPQT